MIETALGFLGKVVGSLVGPLWRLGSSKFLRPSIKHSRAPKNILEFVKPSASEDHVRQVLGPPHRIIESRWFYSFSDLHIQIEFWPRSGAKSIAIGLAGVEKRYRFKVPGQLQPLGKLTIQDVLIDEANIEFRESLRHAEFVVTYRDGPPGAWTNWTFGALSPHAPFGLCPSTFEWDRDTRTLKSDPSSVLINWIALSDSIDEVYFDWSMC